MWKEVYVLLRLIEAFKLLAIVYEYLKESQPVPQDVLDKIDRVLYAEAI